MKEINKLSLIGFFTALYFVISTVIIHFIRNDLTFVFHSLSRFAVGEYSEILQIGLIGIGISEIIIAINLIKKTKKAKRGSIFLFLAGTGAMMVAIFPVNIEGAYDLNNIIHTIGVIIQFICFSISLIYLNKIFVPKKIKLYTLITGLTTLILFIISLILFFIIFTDELSLWGLYEKIMITIIYAWIQIITFKMLKLNPFYIKNII